MTPKERKLQTKKLRIAMEENAMPFEIIDDNELYDGHYRKIVYVQNKKLSTSFSINKIKGEARWTISINCE